ncbi:MAG: serine hydrolase [Porticoccaceae bacterium]|nr:serine hydrolase [Porticoccaceae bacterium]
MHHSSGERPEGFSQDQIAVRYAPNGKPIPFYSFDHRGAAASFSSAHDLVRLGMYFLKQPQTDQKTILSDSNIDEMLRPTSDAPSLDPDKKTHFGVGWAVKDIAGHKSFGHSGGMGGVATMLTILPEEGIAIAVLTNSGSHPIPGALTKQIIEVLLPGEEQRKVFAAKTGLRGIWQGEIETHQGNVPVALEVGSSQEVKVRIGKQSVQSVWDGKIGVDGMLVLDNLKGRVNTDDANIYPHNLRIKLMPRGDILNGYATTKTKPMEGRFGSFLPYWIELKRNTQVTAIERVRF